MSLFAINLTGMCTLRKTLQRKSSRFFKNISPFLIDPGQVWLECALCYSLQYPVYNIRVEARPPQGRMSRWKGSFAEWQTELWVCARVSMSVCAVVVSRELEWWVKVPRVVPEVTQTNEPCASLGKTWFKLKSRKSILSACFVLGARRCAGCWGPGVVPGAVSGTDPLLWALQSGGNRPRHADPRAVSVQRGSLRSWGSLGWT